MRRWAITSRLLQAVILAATLGLTSCQNGNLFGSLHHSGDSGETSVLLSDASTALANKDYPEALALYERVLAKDPNNAEALNGAAVAGVAVGGLDFGTVLANIVKPANGAPSVAIDDLESLIASARNGYSSQAATNSILAGVDLTRLAPYLDTAICRLQRIVSGVADGTIHQDDPSVLIDYGTLCLVRAALRAIQNNFFDVTASGSHYAVVQTTDMNAVCTSGSSDQKAVVQQSARDLAASFKLFSRAATVLNASNDKIVAKLRDDIQTVASQALTAGNSNSLPNSCITLINTGGVNSSLTISPPATDPFAPPTGC